MRDDEKMRHPPRYPQSKEVVPMSDVPARLVDLPTSVRGFCFHDDNGEPYIVLNARLTREQNRVTYLHERRHIDADELYDPDYEEYGRDAGK